MTVQPANCQILQTLLCSLEEMPSKEVSKACRVCPKLYPLKYTSCLQTSSSAEILQRWLGHPGLSLVYLSFSINLKTFYIMIISVYSVKNLHALFSKHGASDAKKNNQQTRTSTAVTRGLWWHRQERLRGNSLAHQGTCGEEEWSGSTSSSGKCLVPSFFFWRRRPLGIKLSNVLADVSEDSLEQPSSFPP